MAARPLVLALDNKVWHDVIPAIEKGYRQVRNSKTEALYLASWGETAAQFHATGKDRIPETVYANTYSKMISYDLDADLLVVGFDDVSHIYTVSNPGVATIILDLAFGRSGAGRQRRSQAFSLENAHSTATLRKCCTSFTRPKYKPKPLWVSARKRTFLLSAKITFRFA